MSKRRPKTPNLRPAPKKSNDSAPLSDSTAGHEDHDGPLCATINVGMPDASGTFRAGLLILDAVTFVSELPPLEIEVSVEIVEGVSETRTLSIPQTHIFFAGGAAIISEDFHEIVALVRGDVVEEIVDGATDDLSRGLANMAEHRRKVGEETLPKV